RAPGLAGTGGRAVNGAGRAKTACADKDGATPGECDAKPVVHEEIVVRAIRADAETPVTKLELDAPRLERSNYSQETPFLLAETPAVTSYSESGLLAGAGYSYFSLRGMHQTRVNMTFDGVPLNDPEESAVYFANFGDFTSALGSIQVQRGVGTSSVGAASYGGAIDFASV